MKKNKIVLGSAIALTLLAISSQKEKLTVNAENNSNLTITTTPAMVSINNTTTTPSSVSVDSNLINTDISNSIVCTPSYQDVGLNTLPEAITVTNNPNYIPSDENYYFIYTIDGTEPTLDNPNIWRADDFQKDEESAICLPTESTPKTVTVKIKRVEYNKTIGETYIATVNYIKAKTEQPILKFSNQQVNIGDNPTEIIIDNDSYDLNYYYTIDGSDPTIDSKKVEMDWDGRYKIQVPTQSVAGTVTVKVVASDGYNKLSEIVTGKVVFKEDTDTKNIDFSLNAPINPMSNRQDGGRINIINNNDNDSTNNNYKYSVYNEYGKLFEGAYIDSSDPDKYIYIYISEGHAPNTDNSSSLKVVVTAINTKNGITSTLTKTIMLNYSEKIYNEKTPQPNIENDCQYLQMGETPKEIIIDKDSIRPNTKYYYISDNNNFKTPLISDEYQLNPDANGNYVIQAPTLNLHTSQSIYYGIVAVEEGKSPSATSDASVNYNYDCLNDISITPSKQSVIVNEEPVAITVTNGATNYGNPFPCIYTIDGTEPTMDNPNVKFATPKAVNSKYIYTINIPSQSNEGSINLNVRMVDDGDGYMSYHKIVTATIDFVQAKTDTPILSPITQTVPVGSYADTIYVTNVNKNNNIKLYYTTDGSIPNTSSKQCYFDYDGKYRINVGTQSKPTTEKLNVIAVEDNKSPSDVVTATVIYAEQTAEPVLTPKYSEVDMGKTPTPIVIDKDNPRLDVDYYYTTDGSQPTISNGYKVLPNENGTYVIQPPTLDSKEDEYFKIRVIAIEKNKAPSDDVDASVHYLYHEPIILTPKTQTKLINETPDTIYITQDSYDCNSIDFSKMIYFKYTTDGTEPTMLNGQSVFFDKNTNHDSIHIPTQDKTGIVTIKVKRVIRNIKPMDLVTNDYIDTRYYTDYIRDNTAIATVNFVTENVDSPILNPTTQTKYTGETPDAIKIENVSENTKYYFTTDGTIPTMNPKEIVADKNNNYEIQIPTQTTDGKVNVKVIAVKDNNQSNITDAEVIFKSKDTPITPVTPPITTDPTPTPSHSNSHHNSELKLIDVYKNDYIKNTDTKVSENNYTWNNTTDNLTGTLEYTDNCYTVKMDKDFDKDTHVVIYDNFKDKPAKLYSYLPDIGMYALLKDDVTATDGTLKFDTTNKGEYVITANELPKDKVLKYWYSLGYNKWIFFNKYSDERLIGWHKADKGELVHNGIDSMGDSFHMADNTIMDMGWFKDKDGSWYYLDNLSKDGINSYGAVLKGWYYLDNNWYYFNLDSGKMTTGWCKINNNWYYFNSDGAMQSNTTIDGYQLNEHGQLV